MAGYIGTQPVPQATQTRDAFTATNNQTSFPTSGYTPEFLDVFLNGVKLAAADYTATNGSDVVLAAGATTGDILEVVSYGTFEVLNPTFDGNVTFTGNASFGDNDKAIFGDGNDLQIYHNGSNSYIDDAGTGWLNIRGSSIGIDKYTGETMATFVADGAVTLYHNNAAKLSTTSTGIDVTGTAVTDGLTTNGAAEGDTYFTGGTANTRLLNVFTSTHDGGANAGHNFKIASGQGAFIFGNNTTANLLTVKSGGIDVTGTVAATAYTGDGSALTGVGSPSIDDNGNATAITIDSSENVMVGTANGSIANNSSGNVGIKFDGAQGQIQATGVSDAQLYLNRQGTDGTIAEFRKDGTAIGSIGVSASNNLAVGSTSGSHAGITFGTNTVAPMNVSNFTNADDAYDLGNTSARWQDLYLSGGVYLGGTGSANHLDDYEVGTWTPTITNSGFTNSASSLTATYTKVGNTVHFELHIVFATSTTVSSHVYISGFPFVSAGSGDSFSRQACGIYNCDDPASGAGYDVGFIRAGQVSGQITLYKGINPASDTQWLARGSIRVT
jgi:hypothetical protein